MHPHVRVGRIARAALIFALIAAAMIIGSVRVRAGGSPFTDAAGHPFAADIEWLWESGITGGCDSTRFCPDATVTREQMASFLVRALALPAATHDYFTDDGGSVHQGDINRLAAAGITGGCGSGRFCPSAGVTREEMASFLARAFGLAATTADYFWDDESSMHEANINRLAAGGISGGCASGRFCPTLDVTRGQMAAFLHRAMEAPLAPPPTAGCGLFPASNVWNRRVDGLPVAAATTRSRPASSSTRSASPPRRRAARTSTLRVTTRAPGARPRCRRWACVSACGPVSTPPASVRACRSSSPPCSATG